jgi:hypothetical protein
MEKEFKSICAECRYSLLEMGKAAVEAETLALQWVKRELMLHMADVIDGETPMLIRFKVEWWVEMKMRVGNYETRRVYGNEAKFLKEQDECRYGGFTGTLYYRPNV